MLCARVVRGALAVGLALSSSFVAAQQRPQTPGGRAPAREGRETTRTESRQTTVHRSSVMIGATVALRGGHEFGKVEEFVIDEGGCVEFVVVAYEKKFVALPWAVATFDVEHKSFTLDIERSRLAQIPTFTEFTVLSTREFRQKNETFFGNGRRDGKNSVSTPRDRDDQEQPRQPGTKDRPGTQPKQPGTQPNPPTSKPPRGTAPGPNPPAKPAPQPGTQPKGQSGGAPKDKDNS